MFIGENLKNYVQKEAILGNIILILMFLHFFKYLRCQANQECDKCLAVIYKVKYWYSVTSVCSVDPKENFPQENKLIYSSQ